MGIRTVLDLKQSDPANMRSHFSVVMEKMAWEINSTSCIELEEMHQPKKQILSSRSFGIPVSDLANLEESVSLYINRAAKKTASATVLSWVGSRQHLHQSVQ